MCGYICKDLCADEKAASRFMYRQGKKYCVNCSKCMKTDKLYCYCCGAILRVVTGNSDGWREHMPKKHIS